MVKLGGGGGARLITSVIFAIALASNARAQGVAVDKLTPAFPTAGERKAADIASWATVITAMALDANATIGKCDGQDQCYRAVTMSVARVGVTFGAVYGLKKLFARQRPCAPGSCGIDNPDYSFPSGHTAFAFSSIGGSRLAFSLPLAFGTGGLRVAANKHWLTDTIAGAGIGLLTSRIR